MATQQIGHDAVEAGKRAVAPESQDSISLSTRADFFSRCEANRELLSKVRVVIPVRPADGVSVKLTQMAAIWYGEGTPFNMLNDHMGGFIECTRAHMAKSFLEDKNAEYLIMIDNDMDPPLDLVLNLIRHDVPVVGGCAMSNSSVYGPQLCFTVKDENGDFRFPSMHHTGKIPARGLKEVGHIGTGALCIKREVLESFTFEAGDVPFYVNEDIRVKGVGNGILLIGEDLSFCNQVRAKGFKMYVDLEVHLGHRKTVALMWPDTLIDEHRDASRWVLPPEGQKILSR